MEKVLILWFEGIRFIIGRQSQPQEQEVSGHVVSAVRKQSDECGAQVSFFFLCSSRPQPRTLRVGVPTLINIM